VLPHYPLQPPIRCELLRAGRNDHYLVHDGGPHGRRVHYFKVHAFSQHFQSRHRERLAQEVAVMNHLDAGGIPVCGHRPADWSYLKELGTALKDRVCVLLPQQAPEYGLIHGDLHQDNVYQDASGTV